MQLSRSRQGSATLSHFRVRAARLGVLLGASLFLGLLVAAPANAGTASITQRGGFTTLEYSAGLGEANSVEMIAHADGSFAVIDTAPVTAGAGCTTAAGGATCAEPSATDPIRAIYVDLRDLDDTVHIDASIRSELLGRTGTDELRGGDGPDMINGGPGPDTINTRGLGKDTVQCDDTDAVISDPNDVVPAGCPNDVAPVAIITGGPNGPTNDTTPIFSFASSDPDVTGFECMIDGYDAGDFTCDSGRPQPELPDGPYFFRVRALDHAPGAGPWIGQTFDVDTRAPQVNVTGPLVSTTATPSYGISSNEDVDFSCMLDDGAEAPCSSPYTTPVLANGTHFLFVTATDRAGNTTTADVEFTVRVGTPPGASGGAPTPVQPRRIIIESLVLISGRTVKMSRKGVVSIRLQCAGKLRCRGRMTLTTAEPVRRKSRKLTRLGSRRFSIAANKRKNVKVRFSKRKRTLAQRLKRFKAKVVITEVDQRGNQRISSRVFPLRAR